MRLKTSCHQRGGTSGSLEGNLIAPQISFLAIIYSLLGIKSVVIQNRPTLFTS